jgi:hypothetical protein
MAKKPISDAQFTSEVPTILRYLEKQHYKSPEWSRDAGIKDRGLGIVEAEDNSGDGVYQTDAVPKSGGESR